MVIQTAAGDIVPQLDHENKHHFHSSPFYYHHQLCFHLPLPHCPSWRDHLCSETPWDKALFGYNIRNAANATFCAEQPPWYSQNAGDLNDVAPCLQVSGRDPTSTTSSERLSIPHRRANPKFKSDADAFPKIKSNMNSDFINTKHVVVSVFHNFLLENVWMYKLPHMFPIHHLEM